MKTGETQKALRAIIRRHYAGSQADFSRACGLDTADTSRVFVGIRPATLGFVRRVARVLDEDAAAKLIAAFLSDVSTELSADFTVTVAIQPKRRVA